MPRCGSLLRGFTLPLIILGPSALAAAGGLSQISPPSTAPTSAPAASGVPAGQPAEAAPPPSGVRPPRPQLARHAPAPASTITARLNQEVRESLPFSDEQDFQDAQRGFIATLPEVVIKSMAGRTVFSLKEYDFLKQEEAPDSVNPSLWRQARLNLFNGLFQVTDGIYQVRCFDISNMTIVEGDTGIIVIDPLSTLETAQAALDLYFRHRGVRPVVAVVYTHSHADHFGGVGGVVSEADEQSGRVQIIAPEGFLEAATSENVFAGTAMGRRTMYFYGEALPKGERSQVDCGLGKAYPIGTITLIPPTDTVRSTGETRTIDGVEIEFQIVSGTEAPAEMTLYFPRFRALDSAEIACPLMHNVLTLRGAQVRDAKKWAKSLDEAATLYGARTDVLFAQHHWPRWGQESVVAFLEGQRDLYEYIHDQTLRLTNHGYTGTEIAEVLRLPATLEKQWWARGYYGTLSHNSKAVYQKYIGWYDGNPANLQPLPPEETAKKIVEYMGGAAAVIAKARQDYDYGEYRWVAQILSNVVFADPGNWEARLLEADALEQLGYQAESGTWRNVYLVGAFELRNGIAPVLGPVGSSGSAITAMTMPLYFDYWGVRLNGDKAEGKRIVINWTITHPSAAAERYALNLSNSALTYRSDWTAPNADASLTLARSTLDAITTGQTTFAKELAAGSIGVTGSPGKLAELLGLLDTFDPAFPVVTP